MSNNDASRNDQDAARIDIHAEAELHDWAKKLDATPDQLKEAVAAVGDLAGDVEMHLKGSRSSSNSDRVHDAL